jgi:hypothetical protein
MLKHGVRESGVERTVGEGQLIDACCLKLNIAKVALQGQGSPALQIVLAEIDADHLTRTHCFSEARRDRAWTAATVEEAHTWSQVRKQEACKSHRTGGNHFICVLLTQTVCLAPDRLL